MHQLSAILGRRRLAIYIALAVLLAAFTPLYIVAIRDSNEGFARWITQWNATLYTFNQQLLTNRRAYVNVRDIFATAPMEQPASRREAERLLNDGKHFSDPGERILYNDPDTGGQVILKFKGYRWLGVDSVQERRPMPSSPPRSKFMSVLILHMLACYGMYVGSGIGLLIFWIVARHMSRDRRIRFSGDLLVLAGAGLALASIGPLYWHTVWIFYFDLSARWGLIVVVAALATFLTARRHQPPSNACRTCGYDLTANESGICPECGSPVPTSPSAHSQPQDSLV